MIVVSGYRRSGTSMMMKALYTGLTEGQLIYQAAQERLNQDLDGYRPNPGDLYEVGRKYYMNAMFLRTLPKDSLVKILYDGLPSLPKGDHKIIFMLRDRVEIEDSLRKSDAHLRARGVKENADTPYTFDVFRPYKQEDIDHVLGICEARKDFELFKIDFKDVIEDSLGIFTALRDCGIPLEPEKAAAVINPSYYRSRKDTL